MKTILLLAMTAIALVAADPVRIDAVCPWEDAHGYSPVVVTISSDRDISLTLTARTMTADGTATVAVPAGGQARRTVLVPTCGSSWINFQQLEWRGGGLSGTAGISSRNQRNELALAVVDPGESLKLKELAEKLNRSPGSVKEEQIQRFAQILLPDRWQGYPPWLTVLLTPPGDAGLDNEQRAALARWSQTGGGLAVTTAAQFKAWRDLGAAPILADTTSERLGALAERIKATRDSMSWQPSSNPVPGTERVPVTAFVIVALGFALLVGPVNLWWVRKRNARHLFLITTPAISFATCVALLVVSLLADGVSVRRSAVQTVLIDHRNQRAVTWTGVTCFAAFSQSSLTLDGEAKLTTADPENYNDNRRRRYEEGERLSLDWRSGQVLGGAVVPARVNRQLVIIEPKPERRRLEITPQGDGWLVTNGLGVDITSMSWRDLNGALWVSTEIAQGQAQRLTKRPTAGGENALDLPGTITQRSGPALDLAWNRQGRGPFAFVAKLAKPMDPLPGPDASDALPPQVTACGLLIPPGQTKEIQ